MKSSACQCHSYMNAYTFIFEINFPCIFKFFSPCLVPGESVGAVFKGAERIRCTKTASQPTVGAA